MTEEWVSFWHQCLAMNIDYSLYCDAKYAGDSKKCESYEARFDHISEIYQDFGPLELWPEGGMASKQWQEWFKPRKHLFMASAKIVSDLTTARPLQGHLLIDVELQSDASATLELVDKLLADHYKQHAPTPPKPPKYALHLKDGQLTHGYEKVRQACASVARSYRYDPVTLEERRHVDAITDFIRHELDNMGWTLDPVSRKELMEFGRLSEQRLNSFKAMINRCRRDFQAMARNTIRGRFPDDTPFDSTVLDLF